ncbi:MAG: DUF882 domain-containing protein [Thiohalobacterales bacterium]
MGITMTPDQRILTTASTAAVSRRDFLRLGAGAAAGLLCPAALASLNAGPQRSLAFYNTHTGESLETVYWAAGEYLEDGLREINTVLRDHRADETWPMDRNLLDLLTALQAEVNCHNPFHVISGYRSPATNARLRGKSSGVARRSYHMQGKAIDLRLPGCALADLHKAALSLKAGGVGSYAASDFIHVDVGPVRRW